MVHQDPVVISYAVEGPVDEAVVRSLVEKAGATLVSVYGKNGIVYPEGPTGGPPRYGFTS